MKKVLVTILAAFMIFAVAGSAAAYFEEGNLILSIYKDGTDNEVGLDLGNINGLLNETNYELAAAGSFSAADFNSSALTDLKVSLFSNIVGAYDNRFSLNKSTTPSIKINGLGSFESAAISVRRLYGTSGSGKYVGAASERDSFFSTFNLGGTANGTYTGLNDENAAFGEGNMVDVGYIDLYIYHYQGLTLNQGPDTATPEEAIIRLYADGSVVLNPTVPVPGAVVLLGSGLLGLVGIRRKK